MQQSTGDAARARREAADWFARLSRRSVTTQALAEFRAWRRRPENRAAYEEVEAVWDRAGALAEDPEIQALRRETRRRTTPRARAARRLRLGLALGGLAAAALVAVAVRPLLPTAYSSGLGEQRILRLADGSVLRLDTDSRVLVRLGRRGRDVRLQRGQALFQVAHDPGRPFRVHADGAVVRAVGTVFDVRMDGDAVGVVLLQGAVQVRSRSGGQVTLAPDQAVQLRGGALTAPRPVDARRAVSWTERRLVFDHTPLAAAVAEVNRYAAGKVELEAPELANAPVSGVFETGDTRSFAAAAASVFDLQVADGRDAALVLRRPAPAVH